MHWMRANVTPMMSPFALEGADGFPPSYAVYYWRARALNYDTFVDIRFWC